MVGYYVLPNVERFPNKCDDQALLVFGDLGAGQDGINLTADFNQPSMCPATFWLCLFAHSGIVAGGGVQFARVFGKKGYDHG